MLVAFVEVTAPMRRYEGGRRPPENLELHGMGVAGKGHRDISGWNHLVDPMRRVVAQQNNEGFRRDAAESELEVALA